MRLTPQQVAHILAALRYCQGSAANLAGMDHFEGEEFGPLDDAGVDELCEALNTTSRLLLEIPENTPGMVLAFPLPSHRREAMLALMAGELAGAWHHFLERCMRPMLKWPPKGQSKETTKTLQEVFDAAWTILRDYDIADLIND